MENSVESVERYITRCRGQVRGFVDRHFTLARSWQLQKQTLGMDLMIAPINSVWVVPYLALRKISETLEKLGLPWLAQATKSIPPGIKTGYQKKIESLVYSEILDLPPTERRRFAPSLEQYRTSNALVTDLVATILTLLFSWYCFGSWSLDADAMAYRFAQQAAHDEAAESFFLGSGVGSAFYELFPPEPERESVRLYLFSLTAALTIASLFCTILSNPLRRRLGLHAKRLALLIDEIEKELLLSALRKMPLPSAAQCRNLTGLQL